LKRLSIIFINLINGEIMALVSCRLITITFLPRALASRLSRFLDDEDRPLFNRSVSGEFPSGSTIKPLFAAGALQEKIIDENTSFLSTGGLRIGEWFFPDWKAGGHGTTNVRKAIAESVNTFFYYIGGGYDNFRGLGLSGLVKYSQLFGLGSKTGIDLPGERGGFVPTKEWKEETKNEPWYIGEHLSFRRGQGDVLCDAAPGG
jgi:penicillin-binding protein 2